MNVVAQVLALRNDRDDWTTHTLEMLTDAAKLAGRLDGAVGVWFVVGANDAEIDPTKLARHGCHIVQRFCHERFSEWQSEAIAATLARNVAPGCRVIFLPGTARGEEVAALLAVHIEAVWLPDVISLAVTHTGALEITAVEPGGKLSRSYRAEADRPAIVTMRAGVAEARTIETPAEIRVENRTVDLSDVPELTQVERFLPADPLTIDITFAERIVAGGRGTGGPEGMQLVASLAETLDASPAASRMVVDLGWATPDRQVGQTGKTVRPDLYVACGISGASHHLAGMRDSRHIVAINTDSEAPIHEVAHLSLCGDLRQVVPAIREAVARRVGPAGPAGLEIRQGLKAEVPSGGRDLQP